MSNNSTIARKKMIQSQLATNKVQDEFITAAIESIPREEFVPEKLRTVAYVDDDISAGEGRFLIEPMIFAKLLRLADIKKYEKVLVVASATGYETAVISQLAREVTGLENNINLISAAQANMKKLGITNVNFVKSELHQGAERQKPFDIIFINGAVEEIPDALSKQLKNDGRIIALLPSGDNLDGPFYGTLIHKAGRLVSQSKNFQAFTPKLKEFNKKRSFNF